MKKPKPVNKHVVCSECGLPWDAHGENPTQEKCVELLKAELSKRPAWQPLQQSSSAAYPFTSRLQLQGIPLHGNDIGKAH